MNLINIYCCNNGHVGEEVLGYCLYIECQNNPAFCFKCLTQDSARVHADHKELLFRFKDIYLLTGQYIKTLTKFIYDYQPLCLKILECKQKLEKKLTYKSKEVVLKLSNIQSKVEIFNEEIINKIRLFESLDQQLQQQDYYKFKENIQALKKISRKQQNQIKLQLSEKMVLTQQAIEQKLDNLSDLNKRAAIIYFQTGQTIFSNGGIEKSIFYISAAILRGFQSIEAYFYQGFALSEIGQHVKAIQSYDEVIKLNPNFPEALINKGNSLQKLANYEDAIKCYDQAIGLHFNFAIVYFNKGEALQNLKCYQSAIGCYDDAIQLDQNFIKAYYNKGIALAKLANYEDAQKCYDEVIRLNPTSSFAYFRKGKLLESINLYFDAFLCYQKAISLDQNSVTIGTEKDNALQSYNIHLDAIHCYNEAIKLILLNIGNQVDIKKIKTSHQPSEQYDEIIILNQSQGAGLINKGKSLSYLYNYLQAIQYLNDARINIVSQIQSEPKVQTLITIICFTTLLKLDPDRFTLYQLKGSATQLIISEQALSAQLKYSEAIILLSEVIDFNYTKSKLYELIGETLMHKAKYELAILYFDEAIKLDPIRVRLHQMKTQSIIHDLGLLGNLQWSKKSKKDMKNLKYQMINCLDEVNKSNFFSIQWHKQKGRRLICEEKYELAMAFLDKAITLYPTNSKFYELKGEVLCAQQKHSEAILLFNEQIRLDPDCFKAYELKGNALLEMEEYKLATECFIKTIELAPSMKYQLEDQCQNKIIKGEVLWGQEKYSKAVRFFNEAMCLDPKRQNFYELKGEALVKQDKYFQGIICFDEAIKLDPSKLKNYELKGYALIQLHQYYDAIKCCDQSIGVDTIVDQSEQKSKEEYKEAIKCFTDAIKLKFAKGNIYELRGEVLWHQRKYNEAYNFFNKATYLDPDSSYIYKRKGDALFSQSNYSEAIKYYDEYIRFHPQILDSYKKKGNQSFTTLGQSLWKLKMYEEALKCCDMAISLEFDEVNSIYELKSQVLMEVSRHKEAAVCFNLMQNSDAKFKAYSQI